MLIVSNVCFFRVLEGFFGQVFVFEQLLKSFFQDSISPSGVLKEHFLLAIFETRDVYRILVLLDPLRDSYDVLLKADLRFSLSLRKLELLLGDFEFSLWLFVDFLQAFCDQCG
jgi:hypothetical protein